MCVRACVCACVRVCVCDSPWPGPSRVSLCSTWSRVGGRRAARLASQLPLLCRNTSSRAKARSARGPSLVHTRPWYKDSRMEVDLDSVWRTVEGREVSRVSPAWSG